MKRLIIGTAVLLFLLILGLVLSISMENIFSPIMDDLDSAATAAAQGEWAQARQLAEKAQARWQRYHPLTAAFSDHAPMEELDGLFARLEVYAHQQAQTAFCAVCGHLSTLAEEVVENHRLRWWTFL